MIYTQSKSLPTPFLPNRDLTTLLHIHSCHHHHQPRLSSTPSTTNKPIINTKPNLLTPITLTPNQVPLEFSKVRRRRGDEEEGAPKGSRQMMLLCGVGYWVQGFRCFPWMALNFHMANTLRLSPSTLQLVQSSANLPMVAKPLYGVLSDAIYIGGAHRIPYVSIGVFLQVISWGTLALVPEAGESLPTLLACMLVSNLGASITEVANDALVAEYGQKWKMKSLQSYAFMALAAGGVLGNLLGGYYLFKTQQSSAMFLLFTLLLSAQLSLSIRTREDSLGLPSLPGGHLLVTKSVSENLSEQFSNLVTAISEKKISSPLYWIVASIAVVPILSGTNFCYQTQILKLDASVIGMSKVIGQMMLLSAAVLYDRWWKQIPMRKFIRIVQIVYAASLLLDLILVKQYNLRVGISNEVYVLCLSGLAETVAQFKVLPFSVLFAKLCPVGCEGSLTSFLASVLCLSSIISGFVGVGLSSLIGVSAGDYSGLSLGILLQFFAALVPLLWMSFVPMYRPEEEKGVKGGFSTRSRRRLKR